MDRRFIIFDIETNDLVLENITTIHTIGIFDSGKEEEGIISFDPSEIDKAIERMEQADILIGHNIIDYDLPVIRKFYPDFDEPEKVIDTLVYARLAYPNLYPIDGKLIAKGRLDKSLMGSHKLKAYGQRLGKLKGDFGEQTDWEQWSPEMSKYCEQDVSVTKALFKKLLKQGCTEESVDLEHEVMKIIKRQMDNGVGFDVESAEELYSKILSRKEELKQELVDTFGTWIEAKDDPDDPFVPKRDNSRYGYVEGAPCVRIKYVTFNPNSRTHIYKRLMEKYDWQPTEYTDGGQPKVSEAVLEDLPYPEADLLVEYLMLKKRTGQIAEGKSAWLKLVTDEDKIHGYVNTIGTVTARMSHSKPNCAQVPANDSPFGEECRELFVPTRDNWKMIGVDASGLELRCLAHYLGKYDNGDYAEKLLEDDIHTVHQHKAGLPTRKQAKRFGYAFLYGAGDELLGDIVADGNESSKQKLKMGKKLRSKFLNGIPALKKLQTAVKAVANNRGYLKGLDARELPVRSDYRALNTLLQGAGAIIMKKALVLLDKDLMDKGYVAGEDYEFMLNVHDEFQMETRPEIVEDIGELSVKAIRDAGEHFDFRCPLDGEYDIGDSWAETH